MTRLSTQYKNWIAANKANDDELKKAIIKDTIIPILADKYFEYQIDIWVYEIINIFDYYKNTDIEKAFKVLAELIKKYQKWYNLYIDHQLNDEYSKKRLTARYDYLLQTRKFTSPHISETFRYIKDNKLTLPSDLYNYLINADTYNLDNHYKL